MRNHVLVVAAALLPGFACSSDAGTNNVTNNGSADSGVGSDAGDLSGTPDANGTGNGEDGGVDESGDATASDADRNDDDVSNPGGSGYWPVLRAFPGAEGFGAETLGGRGGRVIKVTNLNDDGPGSFREAVTAAGPRIVVFDVSGTIELESRVEISEPFLTIAGQTAPGGGITLAAAPSNLKGTMYIVTHDVVMRFVRLRPGTPDGETDSSDGLTVWNNGFGDPFNVVVDHCSFSWATDENLATYHGANNVTFSWNIISEALSNGMHPEGEHSKGLHMSGDGTHSFSVHHNLLAHNTDRNPQPTNPGIADYRNNVVYNYGKHAAFVSDSRGKPQLNFIGNYFKPGPDSEADLYELDVYDGSGAGWEMYVQGNIGPNRPSDADPEDAMVSPEGRAALVATPYDVPPVTTTDAFVALEEVLAGAGATHPHRDAVDERVTRDVVDGTGSIIDNESEVGGYPALPASDPPLDSDDDGMPDAFEIARDLDENDPSDAVTDRNGDGYTNIEEYLAIIVEP